eukprot:3810145-Pyramimonas_sp.AAC.1
MRRLSGQWRGLGEDARALYRQMAVERHLKEHRATTNPNTSTVQEPASFRLRVKRKRAMEAISA